MSAAAEALGPLSRDGFLGGRLGIWQPVAGYRAATDPVLLAAFVDARPGQSVLELGCGAGVASICLGSRVPDLRAFGLEIQPGYADLAERNAAENGVPLSVHVGDLRQPPPPLRAMAFDHVLANPPFFVAGRSTASADAGRDRALREEATLGDWIEAGLRRLRPGGWLHLIHRTERLAALLAALDGPAGAIGVLPVASRRGRPAGRVLLRARKGAAAPLVLHPPLVVHSGGSHAADSGGYSCRVGKVLRGEADLVGDRPED